MGCCWALFFVSSTNSWSYCSGDLVLQLETAANAAHDFKLMFAQLATQVNHVDIDHVGAEAVVVSPNAIKQLFPR